MEKILVTGAFGQIGSELVPALRRKYGDDNVVAAGHTHQPSEEMKKSGPFDFVDVTKKEAVEGIVEKYGIDTIYNLAAVLSAAGERNPQLAFAVNTMGLYNVLEVGREKKLKRLMVPSSIAVFGHDTPKHNTPNKTILRPSTMYGISKVHGELLADYYYHKFGLDVRGVRFPGIIGNVAPPGGGTTDYAVEIFYYAVKHKPYTCFLKPDSTLPMMYMPDALKGLMMLAEADEKKLRHRGDYNLAAFSFSPAELAAAIKEEIPDFKIEYKPDYRQAIADSWPHSIDDGMAHEDWGWQPDYDLKGMVKEMIKELSKRL